MRWIASRPGWSFHEKWVCASTMPGIRNAPAPSTTRAPPTGAARTPLAAAHDARDLVALHEHLAHERRLAAAVEDADVGVVDVGHRRLSFVVAASSSVARARKSRSSRAHSSGRSIGVQWPHLRQHDDARAARAVQLLGHRAHLLRRRDAVFVAGDEQHRRLDPLDRRRRGASASASQVRA